MNELEKKSEEAKKIGSYQNVKSDNYTIEVIEYNLDNYNEYNTEDYLLHDFQLLNNIPEGSNRWINIDGEYTEETLKRICSICSIHPLIYDNILNNNQRPKVEDYGDYLYIEAKMIFYSEGELIFEHICFILGKNFIISFGETKGDVFDGIRNRIRSEGTNIRKLNADYLMYSILDAIIDGYFDVLEVLGEKIDDVEENVIKTSNVEDMHDIRSIKKNLLRIHKYVWPLREVTSWLSNESTELIQSGTDLYIRDLRDHIMQVIDATESYRELLAGLADLYISNISYRLNEVMKVLTIISTIFIPLTFIAGVYGMNFKYMPELGYRWGYGVAWGVMIVIAVLANAIAHREYMLESDIIKGKYIFV